MGLGKRHFCAVVFSDLERHSTAWTALPKEEAVVLIDTYRQTAETLSGRFGALHQNFTGAVHLFLFDSTDVAVQFGLSLIDAWDRLNGCDANSLRLRIGCHFGECAPLQDESAWIGRAIGLAKRVESIAAAGTLFVTESALESLDIPLYGYESAGRFSLKGDYLAERALYRIMSVDQRARGLDQISAEEAFLRGVASVGSSREEYEEEAQWYREALKRRPDYTEAHNNLAILLHPLEIEQEAAQNHS
jgi:class 3 adenylate cyclase